jgi:O-antigen ligase
MERWEQAYYDHNFSGRSNIYPAAIEMFLEKPVFGWGGQTHLYELGLRLGTWGKDEHNLLLYLLLEVGLFGAVPFLIGVWLIVRRAWIARTGTFGYLPLALLTAVGANVMVENGLDFRAKVFWLVLALAASANPDFKRKTTIPGRQPKQLEV